MDADENAGFSDAISHVSCTPHDGAGADVGCELEADNVPFEGCQNKATMEVSRGTEELDSKKRKSVESGSDLEFHPEAIDPFDRIVLDHLRQTKKFRTVEALSKELGVPIVYEPVAEIPEDFVKEVVSFYDRFGSYSAVFGPCRSRQPLQTHILTEEEEEEILELPSSCEEDAVAMSVFGPPCSRQPLRTYILMEEEGGLPIIREVKNGKILERTSSCEEDAVGMSDSTAQTLKQEVNQNDFEKDVSV